MEKERNLQLDYFRVILALLVITPHAQPLFSEDSLVGWLISNGIARVAVPCFFIISGYFLQLKLKDNKALKKYLSHILVIYIVWSLIYLPTYYSSIEPRSFITFALMGYYHLWFLPALIVGTLVLIIANKYIKNEALLLISGAVLFVAGYLMENYNFPYRTFYNGLFFGYPFIVLGYFLQKTKAEIRTKPIFVYITLIVSIFILLAESYFGYKEGIYYNVFLSLYIVCPALFICVLRYSKYTKAKDYIGKLSSGIYYTHILVLTSIIPLSETDNIYKLPLIAIISIVLSIFIIFINKRIKIFL